MKLPVLRIRIWCFLTHGSRIRIRIRYTNPSFLKSECYPCLQAALLLRVQVHLLDSGCTYTPQDGLRCLDLPSFMYGWLAVPPSSFYFFGNFVLVLFFDKYYCGMVCSVQNI
jgi:hypothetical protein